MQSLRLAKKGEKELRVLCLGAHCDDIEIGCGGTLLKLAEEYKKIRVKWVVFSSNKIRKKEAKKSAALFLDQLENKLIEILDFKDGFFPASWSDIKNRFEEFKDFSPDIIFTHYRDDLHQDHRVINELTWNTFRDHLILEYEIVKYDGDLGNPNFFVPLTEKHFYKKKEILFECFKSQLDKQWFDNSLLEALPRIRGVQSASQTKFAEAYYTRKLIL